MKKLLILLIAAIMLAGCTPKEQTTAEEAQTEPTEEVVDTNTNDEAKDVEEDELNEIPESILINGIITEINADMVTVSVLEGDSNPIIVLKLSDNTQWDIPKDMMKVTQYITAEISPAMTRSIPPQSNALKVLGLNDVLLGEVTEVNDGQIVLKPVNFNNHEAVVINLSDKTIWDVKNGSISVGHNVRIAIGMEMTMSIPPITSGVRVLSIETHD